MVGIISYDDYSIQISSDSLKRVVRGEKLHVVKGLPAIFSGVIVQGRSVVPVLSRESFDRYIETTLMDSESLVKRTMSMSSLTKNSSRMFALLSCGSCDFALPLDGVLSIFDDCQKSKSDLSDGRFIVLQCQDLLNYMLSRKGGSNEV